MACKNGTVVSPGEKPDICRGIIGCLFYQKFRWRLVEQVSLTGLDHAARRPFTLLPMTTAQQRAPRLPTEGDGDKAAEAVWGGAMASLRPPQGALGPRAKEQPARPGGGLGGAPPAMKGKTEAVLNWPFLYIFHFFMVHCFQATL